MARKQSGHFLRAQLVLQRGSNGFITEKNILFQGSRGGPTFSRGGGGGGSNFLQGGGPNANFSRLPIPPLDPHMSNSVTTH